MRGRISHSPQAVVTRLGESLPDRPRPLECNRRVERLPHPRYGVRDPHPFAVGRVPAQALDDALGDRHGIERHVPDAGIGALARALARRCLQASRRTRPRWCSVSAGCRAVWSTDRPNRHRRSGGAFRPRSTGAADRRAGSTGRPRGSRLAEPDRSTAEHHGAARCAVITGLIVALEHTDEERNADAGGPVPESFVGIG